MKPLSIEGIGHISARGRGLDAFERALKEGWTAPSLSADGRAAYRIAPGDMADRDVLQYAKRADRFSKLAVLTASDAIRDSGLAPEQLRSSTGIILATAFGAHSSIFKFLDGIIDYGERSVSPTTFAHSVHNAAAAYAANVLGCKGPVMTLTQFHFAFHQALLLAYAWLHEGRVEHVLVGTADECSPAMEYICGEKLAVAQDGRMNPLEFQERPKAVPGEGSIFFLLTLDAARRQYGAFSGVELGAGFKGWEDADLTIAGANGMAGSEKVYRSLNAEAASVEAYSHLYGGLMTGSAFDCAAAALMLKRRVRYSGTALAAARAEKVSGESLKESLSTIQCAAHDCQGQLAFVKLTN